MIRAKLKLGDFDFEDSKPVKTFKEYANSWIKTTVPATCKDLTVQDYKNILRLHILPVFGDLKVTDINGRRVKDFLQDKVNNVT